MAVRHIYMTATGAISIERITFYDSFNQAAASAEILCAFHTLSIGDSVTIDIGFADEHQAVMTGGIVKDIVVGRPEANYTIKVSDVIIKAVDNFIASDSKDSPYTVSNISAEQLVANMFALSSVSPVTADATIFTFAVVEPKQINLISAWDVIDNVCRITGFHAYAKSDGMVRFQDRKPYIMGSDTTDFAFVTGASGTLISTSYTKSEEKIRNRIVVYGYSGIHHTELGSSPYLPAGFYKTLVVGHELIDTQTMAQRTGQVNLEMFNRLTETGKIRAIGKPSIRARSIVTVNDITVFPDTNKWFVYSSRHTVDENGYVVDLTLVR